MIQRVPWCIILVCMFFLCAACSKHTVDEKTKDLQHTAVKEILKNDPSIILDALREQPLEFLEVLEYAVEQKQQQERIEQYKQAATHRFTPQLRENCLIEGKPTAPITIFEYSDFLCGHCRHGNETMQELLAKYPEKIRLVYKHAQLGTASHTLATIFEAVMRIDSHKARLLKDMLFAHQQELRDPNQGQELLASFFKQLNLNPAAVQKISQSKDVIQSIQEDEQEGTLFSFYGAPSYIVDGIPVRGAVPLEEFEDVIGIAQQAQSTHNK